MTAIRNPRKRRDSTGRMNSDAAIRREKLRIIDATGDTTGIHPRSLERFWSKGYLIREGNNIVLTKMGRAVMDGKIGKVGRGAVDFDTANLAATRAGGHNTKRGHAARAEVLTGPNAYRRRIEAQEAPTPPPIPPEERKALAKILGTYAVTIAPSDGSTIDAATLRDFREDGWIVAAAPSAPARVGSRLPGSRRESPDEAPFWNPSDPLGTLGHARAVVIRSMEPLTLDSLSTFRHHGFDLTTAPAKMRNNPPITANPSPGERQHGLHASATQRKAAADLLKKARAFYGSDELTTVPRPLKGYKAPEAFVELGDMVALEYDSNKFDGKGRIYRHDATHKRRLLMSLDGSTIIVWPPFKLTKRGIEG